HWLKSSGIAATSAKRLHFGYSSAPGCSVCSAASIDPLIAHMRSPRLPVATRSILPQQDCYYHLSRGSREVARRRSEENKISSAVPVHRDHQGPKARSQGACLVLLC